MYYLVYLVYERDGHGLVMEEDLKRHSRIFIDDLDAEEYRNELDAVHGVGWMRARIIACDEHGCMNSAEEV